MGVLCCQPGFGVCPPCLGTTVMWPGPLGEWCWHLPLLVRDPTSLIWRRPKSINAHAHIDENGDSFNRLVQWARAKTRTFGLMDTEARTHAWGKSGAVTSLLCSTKRPSVQEIGNNLWLEHKDQIGCQIDVESLEAFFRLGNKVANVFRS